MLLCGCANGNTVESKTEYKLDESRYSMSDNLLDTCVAIDGEVIAFPLKYEEFVKTGYTLVSSEKHAKLQKNQFSSFSVTSGDKKVYMFFANLQDEEKELGDCIVCGVETFASDDITVQLPKNVIVGKTAYKDVISAYGNAFAKDTAYGYENCIKYGDGNNTAYLYFSEDILQKATLYKVADPEKIAVSETVPQAVKDYKDPNELSVNLSDFAFYLYGHTYTMPLPVSQLTENGWINVGTEVEYVPAGGVAENAVKLTNQNRTVVFSIKNLADYPTIPENCFVTSVTSTSDVKLDLTLANGCRVGSTAANLEATFGKKNFTNIESDGKKTVYIYSCDRGTLTVTANDETGYITEIKVEL